MYAKARKYWPTHYEKNKNEILAKQKEYRKKAPNAKRNSTYKYVFGIDLEQASQKLQNQEGVCAVCSRVLDSTTGGVKPQLDHDHTNGMIRDFLCVRCNRVLGHVNDSTELLLKFVSYIQKHKEYPSGIVAKSWKRLNKINSLRPPYV